MVHLSRCTLKSDWLTILLAAQCILLLFRVQYWARAFNASQFAFVDVVWEVIDDTSGLLVFLFMVMAGYGAAFHITFRIAEGGPDEYKTIWRSVLSMYEHVYGDLELKDFYSLKHMRVMRRSGVLGVGRSTARQEPLERTNQGLCNETQTKHFSNPYPLLLSRCLPRCSQRPTSSSRALCWSTS